MSEVLKFTLNSQPVEVLVKPEESLLEVLRDKLRVVSPKCGCDRGDCGACTVMVDGKAVKSCATLALTMQGKSVLTVEGLSNGTQLHPVQKAFIEMGAPQCGICTPGFVMASVAFLQSNPSPTKEEIKEALAGNLCRCSGYTKYVDAVYEASKGTFGKI
ncbi:(2Fe-2S)-binding protein [uncultured Flavonifractor sp.]|uniref:(2Fe-2S)-binding protein n=1 Tax=uncultured Flavonifractor sp. TaxID=1193534 RepID=UPI0026336EB4|nr:(2Fe-2S)-binding protein [uncultured Flavonifractor sp.]